MPEALVNFAEQKGINPWEEDHFGWTLLHHAAMESVHQPGLLTVVQQLLPYMDKMQINAHTRGGTPQGWAALSLLCNARDRWNQREHIIQAVLDHKAAVNVRTPSLATPLMCACSCGFWSAAERLLAMPNVDVHAKNMRNKNALDVTPEDQKKAFASVELFL